MGVKQDKVAMRAEMSRFRIRPEERTEVSEAIRERLVGLECWRAARMVLLYAALPDEPDTFILPRGDKCFCYPRYHADRGYEAARVDDVGKLAPGKFGVLEPVTEAAEVPPEGVDLIVVPGVAFDKECYRLGRGRGFYDQWLLALPGMKIGVGFDHQLLDLVPREPHDVQLDGLIVPSRYVVAGAA
jgi:5-formyltetrahydrofolate cyclo-ligase